MARIRSGGRAFGSLDERRQTLAQVMSKIGLRQLTEAEDETVRGTLGLAIGQWTMAEGIGSTAGLTVKSVSAALRRLGKDLENSARCLSALSTGMHLNHDIEVVMRLADALRQLPGFKSIAEVHAALARFAEEAGLFGQSALVAAELLDKTPSQPGRVGQDWHSTFLKAVTYLCRLNGVRITVATDRSGGEPAGRILVVMEALESLLPRGMRAPSMTARAQRLYRSKRKAKTSEVTKPVLRKA